MVLEDFDWAELTTLAAIGASRRAARRPALRRAGGILRLSDLLDLLETTVTARGRLPVLVAELKHATTSPRSGCRWTALAHPGAAGPPRRRPGHRGELRAGGPRRRPRPACRRQVFLAERRAPGPRGVAGSGRAVLRGPPRRRGARPPARAVDGERGPRLLFAEDGRAASRGDRPVGKAPRRGPRGLHLTLRREPVPAPSLRRGTTGRVAAGRTRTPDPRHGVDVRKPPDLVLSSSEPGPPPQGRAVCALPSASEGHICPSRRRGGQRGMSGPRLDWARHGVRPRDPR